jgi:hypothetical protein
MVSPATLGAEAIVQIWERGRREHPVDRALTILAVLSERPRRELAEISVERRDSLLLAWRSRLFGDSMAGYASCPRCECGVDVSLTAGGLEEPEERFLVEVAGQSVGVRLPTSRDLAALAGCESVEAARRMLVRRCIEGGPAGDGSPAGDGVHDGADVAAAVETELDRRAGVSAGAVALACPDCGHGWNVELDVAAFTWREIEILARQLLRHVDVLARRYGWSEQDILALSPARRRFYLELAS